MITRTANIGAHSAALPHLTISLKQLFASIGPPGFVNMFRPQSLDVLTENFNFQPVSQSIFLQTSRSAPGARCVHTPSKGDPGRKRPAPAPAPPYFLAGKSIWWRTVWRLKRKNTYSKVRDDDTWPWVKIQIVPPVNIPIQPLK